MSETTSEPWLPVPVEDGDYRRPPAPAELCPRCTWELDEDFFCSLCGLTSVPRVPERAS